MISNPSPQPFPSEVEKDSAADVAAIRLPRGCPLLPALSPSEVERESGPAVGNLSAVIPVPEEAFRVAL